MAGKRTRLAAIESPSQTGVFMPVYVIAQIKIHDPEGFKKYEEGVITTFMK